MYSSHPATTGRIPWYLILVAQLVLAVAVTAFVPGEADATSGPTAAARATSPERAAAPSPLAKANAALDLAVTQLGANHPTKAATALRKLSRQSVRAHIQAAGLIGKPPTDPESDDPPGPPAVLAVLRLDHRATNLLVPLYDHETNAGAVTALSSALTHTNRRRNALIRKVVALPPEGAGDVYADGMSDTLPQYKAELRQIDATLASATLTDAASTSLTLTRARVVKADTMMNRAYGGGERPAA